MDSIKYTGLDVHKEAIVIAVLNGAGRLVMESISLASRTENLAHHFIRSCFGNRLPCVCIREQLEGTRQP
jgi:hypothetical protein